MDRAAPQPPAALVTGGGTGIGRAIAAGLLDRGHGVTICGRRRKQLEAAAAELGRSHPQARVLAQVCDVAHDASVAALVASHMEAHGRLDVLVNNAGVGAWQLLEDMTEADWDETVDIDLKGLFLVTRHSLPHLRQPEIGHVVNISSLSGKQGMRFSTAYSAAKFGVIGFTESLLKEEADHGIRATSICPGLVDTPMVAGAGPVEEMIRPEDVWRTVAWLLDLGPQVIVREVVLHRAGADRTPPRD